MLHRIVALSGIACAAISACLGGSAHAAAPPLAALAVRVSDLPRGFYPFQTTSTHGSVPSYRRLFLRRSWATGGWTLVEHQLFAYPNDAAAARAFARRRTQLAHSGVVGTTTIVIRPVRHPTPVPANPRHPPPSKPERYHPMRLPPIGDQSAAFTVISAGYASEYAFTNDLLLFRQGTVCEVLRVVGFYGQVAPGDFLRLAQRLAARAHAGRGLTGRQVPPSPSSAGNTARRRRDREGILLR